jgi:hypothetical protein
MRRTQDICRSYFKSIFGQRSNGTLSKPEGEHTNGANQLRTSQGSVNENRKKWAEIFFIMQNISPISDYKKMNFIQFFHLYELQAKKLKEQNEALK